MTKHDYYFNSTSKSKLQGENKKQEAGDIKVLDVRYEMGARQDRGQCKGPLVYDKDNDTASVLPPQTWTVHQSRRLRLLGGSSRKLNTTRQLLKNEVSTAPTPEPQYQGSQVRITESGLPTVLGALGGNRNHPKSDWVTSPALWSVSGREEAAQLVFNSGLLAEGCRWRQILRRYNDGSWSRLPVAAHQRILVAT